MGQRNPLLPRPVLVFISVVVTLGWLVVVVAAVLNPNNSGALVVVSGLLTAVIGAAFGIGAGKSRSGENKSGDDSP